jgi:hypothetical protein
LSLRRQGQRGAEGNRQGQETKCVHGFTLME